MGADTNLGVEEILRTLQPSRCRVIRPRIRNGPCPSNFVSQVPSYGTGAFDLKTSCLISHRSLPLVFAQAHLTQLISKSGIKF
jgi:hypothetical protein